MTEGLHRYYGQQDLHFITCSCYHRQPQFGTPERRDLFLRVLEAARQRYRFVVVGYVLMPEHFHLLMSEPQRDNPSVVMKVIKERFTRLLKRSNTLVAPVWQKRFYDFNVWTSAKRVEKLRYMHRNPVKRGLVERPEDWKWSSFRSYAYGEEGLVQVNAWVWTLDATRSRSIGTRE